MSRDDIFVRPHLPLLIPQGKQAVIEPWMYECMSLVKQSRYKTQGLPEEVAQSRSISDLQEAGFVPLRKPQASKNSADGRNREKGSGKGPLSTFFK